MTTTQPSGKLDRNHRGLASGSVRCEFRCRVDGELFRLSGDAGYCAVGIEDGDIDAGAVRLQSLEEPPRPGGLGRGVLAGLVREPHAVDAHGVGHVAPGVGGGFVGERPYTEHSWRGRRSEQPRLCGCDGSAVLCGESHIRRMVGNTRPAHRTLADRVRVRGR